MSWYNFNVKFKEKGSFKFNICNFTKKDSLYDNGLRPFIFSKKIFEKEGVGWH